MTAPLRRVLVRPPSPEAVVAWRAFGWRGAPDPVEHRRGARGVPRAARRPTARRSCRRAPRCRCRPMRSTSSTRRSSRTRARSCCGRERKDGAPRLTRSPRISSRPAFRSLGKLEAPATVEGGDTLWLDETTLLVGRGYRTNDAGVAALAAALPGVAVDPVRPAPLARRRRGAPPHVAHLAARRRPRGRLSAAACRSGSPSSWPSAGIELVEVPDEEFETMGPNVLALGPRVGLALDGSPVTRGRMEAAGVDVRVYKGDALSRLGDGGPPASRARFCGPRNASAPAAESRADRSGRRGALRRRLPSRAPGAREAVQRSGRRRRPKRPRATRAPERAGEEKGGTHEQASP